MRRVGINNKWLCLCLFLLQVFPLQYELAYNVTLNKCGFRKLSDMKDNIYMFQPNDIYGIILAKVIRFNWYKNWRAAQEITPNKDKKPAELKLICWSWDPRDFAGLKHVPSYIVPFPWKHPNTYIFNIRSGYIFIVKLYFLKICSRWRPFCSSSLIVVCLFERKISDPNVRFLRMYDFFPRIPFGTIFNEVTQGIVDPPCFEIKKAKVLIYFILSSN